MDIIECDFEFSGFDDHLVKAGTSVYLWNLCREFRAAGHSVTCLTPAHGLLGHLRERYAIRALDWSYTAKIPVRLDPAVWPQFAASGQADIALTVTAHQVEIDGVRIVFLSGGMLDDYTGSFYPPPELEGQRLGFLKPLVFQVAAARFLTDTAAPGTVLHMHEPAYHYLIPAALRGQGLVMVSTVQTNLPVTARVYEPEVMTLLSFLGADPGLTAGLGDPAVPPELRDFLPMPMPGDRTERPDTGYISLLGLVARSADALDFLSEGQLEHALTHAGSPFEHVFSQFSACRELLARRDRLFVGGCAIGDEWLGLKRSDAERKQTLTTLGLDPSLPTVYHNARYTVQHKGQQEMFRAIARLLDEGERFNALLHCLAPRPPADPDLDALRQRHPDLVRIVTGPMTQLQLAQWALASDLCLFPSKFEMDTFLIAMGEAMAAGAVPIATAQQGMRHFRHAFDLADPAATGLALPRSFRVNDPALTGALCAGIRQLLDLLRNDPGRFEELRDRAVAVARQFSWRQTADRFIDIFLAAAELSANPEGGSGA